MDIWSSASDHTKMVSRILILIVPLWIVGFVPSESIQTHSEYHGTFDLILLIQRALKYLLLY